MQSWVLFFLHPAGFSYSYSADSADWIVVSNEHLTDTLFGPLGLRAGLRTKIFGRGGGGLSKAFFLKSKAK